MYRKKYEDLLKWKRSDSRKPLILLGARQVGKTWLMKEFGKHEYKSVAYINCDNNELARHLFEKDYDVSRILLAFQTISGVSIRPAETLIIIDEIQEAPHGLSALKYFCEEAREYHVMAAGSLLGITLERRESFPVGKVDMEHIYPMDFEEFLIALGEERLCSLVRSGDNELIAAFASKLTDRLYQYYFVGGMPEVVASYVRNSDLNEVRRLQGLILENYRMDISKHTSKTESIRIGQVLDSLPSQLAKENGKFIYGVARPGGRAADFELAIRWLIDAGLVYKVSRVNKLAVPLKFYEDIQAFKLYLLDVGLLCRMTQVPATVIIMQEKMVELSGMLTEEYVAQQLASNGFTPYYWSNPKTKAEIDFAIAGPSRVIPIEVKATVNVKAKSLMGFLSDNPDAEAWRLSLLPPGRQNRIVKIPLYAIPMQFDKWHDMP